MSSEDLIVIEGRAERAATPQPDARDNSFDADRTFQNHAREDVLALVAAVRSNADRAVVRETAIVHAALALVEYSELYGALDNRVSPFTVVGMIGYRGTMELGEVRDWLREQVR